MEIIGKQVEFGVATETSRGTAETTANKWMRKVVANVVERATHAIDETTRGKLEDGEGRRVVEKYVEGNIEGVLHADMIGWLLANIYGAVDTTVVSGSVNSHVFSLKQSIQHASLTLFAKDGAVQQKTFSNAMINTLEISASVDDFVRFTAGFIASVSASNSDSPSYGTEYDFIARDITVKVASSEAGLSGATALKAKNFSIKFDQGLIRDNVVGSYTPDDIYNGKLSIEGTFDLNFADTTFKDLYLSDTAKYMEIKMEGSADIGSGNHPSITVLLNKVQFMDWNRNGGASELVGETIGFRAFYNPTDEAQSTVTVKNLTAEYDNVPSA